MSFDDGRVDLEDTSGPSLSNSPPIVRVSGLLAKPWGALEIELPTNVSTEEQLASLPSECLSGDTVRPLQHINEDGETRRYALKPMFFSVIFILLVELFERFSYYGIVYTQTSYLTGAYNKHWNAGMASVEASSYVSVTTAIAYTAPFCGAMLADKVLGDYTSVLFGCLFLYLPGLVLIALTTVPGLLGEEFNNFALKLGLLFFWPVGTGIVKSIVNVFGAKQFHPLLQSSLIETYYVNFYMCINIGALVGGILVPVLAQSNVTLAYSIPVGMLAMGVFLFVLGTPRYVRSKPHFQKRHKAVPSQQDSSFSFATIFLIGFLIIPFCIAYSQMSTTFIVQGTVMRKAFGWIDAASMNNADAVAVLLFGYIIGNYFYPELARRNIKIPTTYKFAVGSALAAMAIGCALMVEYKIHSSYENDGTDVSVLWQVFAYSLIGIGEIFAVSSAYEIAFTISPPEKKAQASAVNLFCVGGLPSFLCIVLYRIGARWFRNSNGTSHISELPDYVEAKVANYFWVLFFICIAGVVVNLLPGVKNWVASIEEEAAIALKTPAPTPKIGRKPIRDKLDEIDLQERTALIKAKKHQNYLKYGSGPTLYKHGSFRAGFTQKVADQRKKRPPKYIKYGNGLLLYKNTPNMSPVARSNLDAQTERAVHALEVALEGKALNDPAVSNSTL
jgi:dipeptide/tripeptide permease